MREIEIQKSVYDRIYQNAEGYNKFDSRKNLYVDVYARSIDGPVLDAGCGEGIHLKRLIAAQVDAFGIDLSEVCCQKFLAGIPHRNEDIIAHAQGDARYSGAICMDVLEHIPPDLLEATLEALATLSPSVLLGIANHSDFQEGVELHPIQEDSSWWLDRLGAHFSRCELIQEFQYPGGEPRFFLIECDREDPGATTEKTRGLRFRRALYDLVSQLEQFQQGRQELVKKVERLDAKVERLDAKLDRIYSFPPVRFLRFVKRRLSRGGSAGAR